MTATRSELQAQRSELQRRLKALAGATDSNAIRGRATLTDTIRTIDRQLATPMRRKAPASLNPRPTTARDIADGLPLYEIGPAHQAKRSAPPTPHVHSKPFDRSATLLRAFRSGVWDAEHLATASYGIKRDLALAVLEIECRDLSPSSVDHLEALVRRTDTDVNGRHVASWVIACGTERYRTVWSKAMQQSKPAWSPADVEAITCYNELMPKASARSAMEGSFGLALPVPIDPTVVIGAALEDARILQVAKVVQTTSDTWKGVSSTGGGRFTLPGEGVVVADGSPTFSQPAITVFALKNWIPFSLELGQDYPDFAGQMASIFQADYLDRVALDTAIGAGGTSGPMGLFTRMGVTTSNPSHVTVTSAGSISGDDVRSVWDALPERSKNDPSCSWLMSDSVWQRISALAAPQAVNGLSPHDVRYVPAAELTTLGNGPLLFGKPVILSGHCPAFSGTTGAASYLVAGAFSRYAIAQRIGGLTTELVPLVPDFSNGERPSGMSGYLCIARYGADVLDVNAFRLLANS